MNLVSQPNLFNLKSILRHQISTPKNTQNYVFHCFVLKLTFVLSTTLKQIEIIKQKNYEKQTTVTMLCGLFSLFL
jgi:hypothetical protein